MNKEKENQLCEHMRKNFSSKMVIQSTEGITECVRCGQPVAGILHCTKCIEELAQQIDKGLDERMEEFKTPGTPEFLEKQGRILANAYCEDCDYETDIMPMKDLVFKLSMEGGYIISDGEGGYYSQCPKCKGENLTLGHD